MTGVKAKGFVAIEAIIIAAILVALAGAAVGGYTAYHYARVVAPLGTTTEATGQVPVEMAATGTAALPLPAAPGSADAGADTTPRVVTNADSGSTLHLHPSESFILKLGSGLEWSSVHVSDTSVLAPDPTFAAVPDAQGMYGARSSGTAVVTAEGRPHCDPGMICAQYIVEFHLAVVVE